MISDIARNEDIVKRQRGTAVRENSIDVDFFAGFMRQVSLREAEGTFLQQ